jgi:hypothetical protein
MLQEEIFTLYLFILLHLMTFKVSKEDRITYMMLQLKFCTRSYFVTYIITTYALPQLVLNSVIRMNRLYEIMVCTSQIDNYECSHVQ